MKRYHLHVISALCTNLAIVWTALAFVAENSEVLIKSIVYAIVSVICALEAERRIEEYEYR